MELGDTVQRDISVFGCKQTKVIVIDFTVSFRLSWDLLTRSKIGHLTRTHRAFGLGYIREYFSSKTWLTQQTFSCQVYQWAWLRLGWLKADESTCFCVDSYLKCAEFLDTAETAAMILWVDALVWLSMSYLFVCIVSACHLKPLCWSAPLLLSLSLSINWARIAQMWLH